MGMGVFSHNTESTHWSHPADLDELPDGWEKIKSVKYGTYYVNHVSKQTQFERPTRPQFSSLPYHSNSQLSLESRSSGGSHTASHNRHSVYSQNSMSSFTSEQTITAVPAPGQALQTPTIPAPVEIPEWLLVYARTPTNDHRLDWEEMFSAEELESWDKMLRQLHRKELEHIVMRYEEYRVALNKSIEHKQWQKRRTLLKLAAMAEETFV